MNFLQENKETAMTRHSSGNWTQLSGNIFRLGHHWKPSTGKPEQIQTKAVMFETIIIFIVDPHRALVQTLDSQNRTATINTWKQKGLSSYINIFTVHNLLTFAQKR